MVSPVCWWCPLETSFVLLVCACNLCCAQCTHCLSCYTEQGVNAWEREQRQFLAQNKYFSLKHLLPRNHLSSQHWPCIYHWAARNHALSRSHFHRRLFPLSVSGKLSGTDEDSVVLPVFRTGEEPTLSYTFHLGASEVPQRVCGCGALTYLEKEPCETLKSHLVTKNPMKLTHFCFENLCRRWPFLVFTKLFSFKDCWSLGYYIQFQWTVDNSLPCHLSVRASLGQLLCLGFCLGWFVGICWLVGFVLTSILDNALLRRWAQ